MEQNNPNQDFVSGMATNVNKIKKHACGGNCGEGITTSAPNYNDEYNTDKTTIIQKKQASRMGVPPPPRVLFWEGPLHNAVCVYARQHLHGTSPPRFTVQISFRVVVWVVGCGWGQ